MRSVGLYSFDQEERSPVIIKLDENVGVKIESFGNLGHRTTATLWWMIREM